VADKITEISCKDHPDAPHGFLRDSSHTEGRYVCECEYWEPSKESEEKRTIEINDNERKAIDAYLSDHWAGFLTVAQKHLSDSEIAELTSKLEGEE
jgi:hypothetical protein